MTRSLLLPPKNLRDARVPRPSLAPRTGSRTATSDVKIAGHQVKADPALLFGRLTAQRVGDFRLWVDCRGHCSPIPLRASGTDRCPSTPSTRWLALNSYRLLPASCGIDPAGVRQPRASSGGDSQSDARLMLAC